MERSCGSKRKAAETESIDPHLPEPRNPHLDVAVVEKGVRTGKANLPEGGPEQGQHLP
jgi:hypothetical protein